MEHHPLLQELLFETPPFTNYHTAEKWYDDILTQGHALPNKMPDNTTKTDNIIITQMATISSEQIPTSEEQEQLSQNPDKSDKSQKKKRDDTISFIDAFASNIDEMFSMYSYETKRDIRLYIRDKLIDWVAVHARKFFGPSTSRSISTCLRTRGITMDDLQKFAELVSFFLNQPIQAGNKTVVWHGFSSSSRDPICELIIKQQGVFVKQL